MDDHEIYEFGTFLPIQFDATCNGFQHLSLLSLDATLGLELNLTQSSKDVVPKDLCSSLITTLMEFFENELNCKKLDSEVKDSYMRITNANLTRYIIKRSSNDYTL